MKIKLIIIYTLLFLFLASPLASAGLGVSGAIIERTVDQGETFAHEMTVSSDSSSPPMDLTVDILGMNQTIEGENIELEESDDLGPYSALTLLKVTPTSFHLEPGESQKVIVECKIPFNAAPGGRYALISIHSRPMGNGTVGIIVAVEVPVRLTISGSGIKKTGRIEDLRLEDPVSSRRQKISLILKNTGNCHYKAIAYAAILDTRGKSIANASTPLSSNIIPGASRIFQMSTASKQGLAPGKYLVNVTAKLVSGSIVDTKETKFEVKSGEA